MDLHLVWSEEKHFQTNYKMPHIIKINNLFFYSFFYLVYFIWFNGCTELVLFFFHKMRKWLQVIQYISVYTVNDPMWILTQVN